jgi:hypothetical protein
MTKFMLMLRSRNSVNSRECYIYPGTYLYMYMH